MITIKVDQIILLAAVRYALGRHSYMPGIVANEVMKVWPQLGLGMRNNIIRDIEEHIHTQQNGTWEQPFDGVDLATWVNLLRWINSTTTLE